MAEMPAKEGKSNLPMGAGLTALDEDYRENLYQVLDDLRERAPVLRDTELNHVFVTRHDDVKAVLRDRDLLVDPRTTLPDDYVRLFPPDAESETYEPSMLFLDDPDHRRLRGIVTQAFNPRSIEAMRPALIVMPGAGSAGLRNAAKPLSGSSRAKRSSRRGRSSQSE